MAVKKRARKGALDLLTDARDESPTIDLSRLRDGDVKGLAIRFAFGFTIAVCVGTITEIWGDRFGGLFLAFPAILPASLTLIAETEGERKARINAGGAIIGGIALSFFGLCAWLLLSRLPVVGALLVALVAWCVVAVGGYFFVRARLRD